MMNRYDITDYGAVADGSVCTEAIQRAIDLCEKGGTVYVPAGTFVTGALFLKSDMTLYLEKGARLLGSSDVNDFPVMSYAFEGRIQLCYASLINTAGVQNENKKIGVVQYKNITIDGEGTIDANGVELFVAEMAENKGKRGRAVCIRNTENLVIRGVTIRQSPAWCLHLIYCGNVLIENIEVHTKYDEDGNKYEHIFNGDGIDIDTCHDVHVQNSLIASQDDCIAIKAGHAAERGGWFVESANIVIENCEFKSGFGVAIGSEIDGCVKNVVVRNCTFENTHSIASIKALRGRGGYAVDIHYENCSLVNRDTEITDTKWFRGALYADAYYGKEEFDADTRIDPSPGATWVNNVYMKNITIDTIAGNAIYLCGSPEVPFHNFYLENITVHRNRGMFVKNVEHLEMVNVKFASDDDTE